MKTNIWYKQGKGRRLLG